MVVYRPDSSFVKKIARKEFMEHDIFTIFVTGRARQFLVGNFLEIKRLEAFIDHTNHFT